MNFPCILHSCTQLTHFVVAITVTRVHTPVHLHPEARLLRLCIICHSRCCLPSILCWLPSILYWLPSIPCRTCSSGRRAFLRGSSLGGATGVVVIGRHLGAALAEFEELRLEIFPDARRFRRLHRRLAARRGRRGSGGATC